MVFQRMLSIGVLAYKYQEMRAGERYVFHATGYDEVKFDRS